MCPGPPIGRTAYRRNRAAEGTGGRGEGGLAGGGRAGWGEKGDGLRVISMRSSGFRNISELLTSGARKTNTTEFFVFFPPSLPTLGCDLYSARTKKKIKT